MIKKKVSKVVPIETDSELLEGLRALGINASPIQVTEAMNTLYPSGPNGVESSSILRAVFIHLRAKEK